MKIDGSVKIQESLGQSLSVVTFVGQNQSCECSHDDEPWTIPAVQCPYGHQMWVGFAAALLGFPFSPYSASPLIETHCSPSP